MFGDSLAVYFILKPCSFKTQISCQDDLVTSAQNVVVWWNVLYSGVLIMYWWAEVAQDQDIGFTDEQLHNNNTHSHCSTGLLFRTMDYALIPFLMLDSNNHIDYNPDMCYIFSHLTAAVTLQVSSIVRLQ